jgi:hypothetical protein
MYRFLVVIEKANNNYSAYSPDLPGCVATGATREEAEKNMYEAIEMPDIFSITAPGTTLLTAMKTLNKLVTNIYP